MRRDENIDDGATGLISSSASKISSAYGTRMRKRCKTGSRPSGAQLQALSACFLSPMMQLHPIHQSLLAKVEIYGTAGESLMISVSSTQNPSVMEFEDEEQMPDPWL